MEWEIFLRATIALIIITDPLGNVPLFLYLTEGMSREERRKELKNAVIWSFTILLIFAVLGETIMRFLDVSLPSLRIAGGILLLLISFNMMFGKREEQTSGVSVGVVPLATPLIAGPGAITTVLVYTNILPGFQKLLVVLSIFLAILLTWFVLKESERLYEILGRDGSHALTRIMSILLAAIAVEMMMKGVTNFIMG
ncbi:MAG: multiple antibiotic resistance protein [Archaeoglobi archaeon]|nr:MarC family protein [Candidatus Mnemosynella bozhongmuii]MDK2782346.1 multiple antibiotic resistance protein [Archaeoglobi archaeon]